MELSANDIRNYEFPTQLRGYDKDEVDHFLEEIAIVLEKSKQENLKLTREMEATSIQLTSLKQFEDTIKDAAIDARRNADITMANAKTEAQQTIVKAHTEAESLIGARADEVSKIEAQIAKLEHARRSYLNKVRGMIESHLEIIEEILEEEPITTDSSKEEPSKAKPSTKTKNPSLSDTAPTKRSGDIQVFDSSEVSREQLETVATAGSEARSIKTEEAQAADNEIINAATNPGNIDSEVAAALQQYQNQVAEQKIQEHETPAAATITKPSDMVETNSKASDLPPEFIRSDADKTASGNSGSSGEPPSAGGTGSKPTPEELSAALDDVVKTFEEKMDEAAGK